jgi:fatty-acyl-CoA synthase
MIIGSEPVSMEAIEAFTEAFAPHGLPATAIKPSYGIAEATLMVATTAPDAVPTASYFDGERLAAGTAVRVAADAPNAVAHVTCGRVARSLWAVIVDPETGEEIPDGRVGEIWLHGTNVGRGYWNQPEQTRRIFGARLASRLPSGSRAAGVPPEASWLRTTDLGMFVDNELYVTGRIVDLMAIGGRNVYPQDIEATAAEASPLVRRGYVTAFTAPDLVIVAERAPGTTRSDPQPAIDAIGTAVARRHGVTVEDVVLLPAGAIPRTTSGKLARRACRAEYLDGSLKAKAR